jgi:signal peptidase II
VTPPARTGFGVAALTFLVDQASKAAFLHYRDPFSPDGITVTSFFRLIYVQNKGISLGMLTAGSDGQRWALVAITLAISVGAAIWLARETNRFEALGLGLIVGGAAGNVLDRIRLGYVVDFLNLHFGGWSPFLVFNVADSAITLGVLVLLARALMAGPKEQKLAPRPTGEE